MKPRQMKKDVLEVLLGQVRMRKLFLLQQKQYALISRLFQRGLFQEAKRFAPLWMCVLVCDVPVI